MITIVNPLVGRPRKILEAVQLFAGKPNKESRTELCYIVVTENFIVATNGYNLAYIENKNQNLGNDGENEPWIPELFQNLSKQAKPQTSNFGIDCFLVRVNKETLNICEDSLRYPNFYKLFPKIEDQEDVNLVSYGFDLKDLEPFEVLAKALILVKNYDYSAIFLKPLKSKGPFAVYHADYGALGVVMPLNPKPAKGNSLFSGLVA